jgi:hypothetical protein
MKYIFLLSIKHILEKMSVIKLYMQVNFISLTRATQILQNSLPPIVGIATILVLFVEVIGDIIVQKICSIICTHNHGFKGVA